MYINNIIPLRLKKGDIIGIVLPCDVKTADKLEPAVDIIKEQGFRVKLGNFVYKPTIGYAATAEERAADFNAMIYDNEVRMVFFGGGEVGNEILPLIDYKTARKNPKIYCSYSDGTSILNAITANCKIVTYHGQTPRTFTPITEFNLWHFNKRLMTSDNDYLKSDSWTVINNGVAEGIMVGGYTQNVALLTGSRYMKLDLNQKYILFLEDHRWFSIPAAVSRYISHIEQSDLFTNVTGLIFGQYSNDEQSEIIEILKRFGAKHKIPIVKCNDFGHESNNAIFPIGMKARLDANNEELRFLP
ncbi:MAG: hypothetical protein A2Y17_06665 [Clostridiales bacterium GWF2_38_85]|nr:MAG: hypothetical protein A2Y17_06665 [Clostridiales bacterium GWF2_38_85]HBL84897.1 LD-carboxypeptidase [Clostridiales bacterium]